MPCLTHQLAEGKVEGRGVLRAIPRRRPRPRPRPGPGPRPRTGSVVAVAVAVGGGRAAG